MRLVTYAADGAARAGVIAGDGTVVAARDIVREAPDDVVGIIAAGGSTWRSLAEAAKNARGGAPVDRAKLLAPIPRPRRNVFCVGWNYTEHFAEGRAARGPNEAKELPQHPSFFSKNPNTVVGPGAAIRHPAPISDRLDWEVELAVLIGRGGIDIPESSALGHVFGYTIANDVSVRDVQHDWHGGQWFKGKNFDTHLPLGPWIVTADELGDPQDLAICTRLNGVTKQDARTSQMVFSVARIIAELSAGLSLEPGDIVITGTPSGVGNARVPKEFMKPGDTVEVEIGRIGVLKNTIRTGI